MALTTVPAIPKHLRQKYLFSVKVAGFRAAYFQKIDRPKVTYDEVEFNPAGSHRPEKLPGRMGFGDIVLEKGVSAEGADNEVFRWMTKQADFVSGQGSAPADMLRDVEIEEYNRLHVSVGKYILIGAFVKEYDGGELTGEDSDNVIDSITLSYQYLEVA